MQNTAQTLAVAILLKHGPEYFDSFRVAESSADIDLLATITLEVSDLV